MFTGHVSLNCVKDRGLLRTLLNIHDEFFCKATPQMFIRALTLFLKVCLLSENMIVHKICLNGNTFTWFW